jgi:alkylation response protein AidB-like acyl-CoA dehydrogenase
LDEVTVQATEKSRGRPPSLLVTQPQFQFSLGKAELELASARALAIAILSAAWEQAATGSVPPPAMQAEVRAAASYVTEVAQRVTTVAFQSWAVMHFSIRIRCNAASAMFMRRDNTS